MKGKGDKTQSVGEAVLVHNNRCNLDIFLPSLGNQSVLYPKSKRSSVETCATLMCDSSKNLQHLLIQSLAVTLKY